MTGYPAEARPAGWSERQLRTLAEIFATIAEPAYEGESERHARVAAAVLAEVADEADLRAVRLTLSLLGTPAGSWAIAQRAIRPREALLRAWSSSRLGARRSFYQLVKRLACFFAYADPGPAGANPRWAAMGYEWPAEPVADDAPIERALLRGSVTDGAGELRLDAEVVVVGSGAGGGVAAARLAERGRDVLVIERARYAAEADLPTNELDAFDRLYLDHGLTASGDLGVAILAGSAVGGGTMVNWTTCLEPPASVRYEWAHAHGLEDFDGPDADRDLARLHDELGFAPPHEIPPKDRLILDGAAALGWEAAPTMRNADGCGDCGACGFGCRRGAKRSGQRLHLAAAAGGGARLLDGAIVERIEIAGGNVSGVRGQLVGAGGIGRPFVVRAQSVVLAAGALRTPALLLRSGIGHPQVGRNLHLHPSVVVVGRLAHPVQMWRGPTQAARSLEFLDRGIVIESAPAHPGLVAIGTHWESAAGLAGLMREASHSAPLAGIVRDRDGGGVTVRRSGRVRIDYRLSAGDAATARSALVAMARMARAGGASRVTALGTPHAQYEVPSEGGDESEWRAYLDRLARFDLRPNRGAVFSAHQMGTVRAGGDVRAHPCDPWGRVRSDMRGSTVKGLYVADAALFPTALGVNPMVTVMALAARVAGTVYVDLPAGAT